MVRHIQSAEEYDRIVSELAEEFAAQIDNGATKDVAVGLVATMEEVGSMYTVQTSADVQGGGCATLDETLTSSSILFHSDANPKDVAGITDSGMGRIATLTLGYDMHRERFDT